jgi:hypothetical protein
VSLQADHPVGSSEDDSRWLETESELKRRVEAAAGDDDAIKTLSWELTSRELTTVVRALGLWSDLRGIIRKIIEIRPKSRFTGMVWKIWQSHPTDDKIESALMGLASRFGWAEAVGPGYAGAAERWFDESWAVLGIVHWMDDRRHSLAELPFLENSPFRESAALIQFLFFALLTAGSRSQLQEFTDEEILDGWEQLDPLQRMEAGRNYLRRTPTGHWAEILLQDLRNSYGMPEGERHLHRFWADLSPEIREAFREFFVRRDLETAFSGDKNTDRHEYWSGWAGQMKEVRLSKGARVEWALMDFGSFSVLEFFKVGNAAYFYRRSDLSSVSFTRNASPEALKQIIYQPVPGFHENRLIHSTNWEEKATRMVKAWRKNA